MQERSAHDQQSFVRFDARLCVLSFLVLHSVSLGLQFHRDGATRGKRFMARFQSRVLSDVLDAFAPIFLFPLSFRGPRIVRRHVLLSSR